MRQLPYYSVVGGIIRVLLVLVLVATGCRAGDPPVEGTSVGKDVVFTRDRKPEIPWSINILQVSRHAPGLTVHTVHAGKHALGLATVGEQAVSLDPALGTPLGAVNGDFYERQGIYAGDPRGLQIVESELISAPAGTASFWIDAAGGPHTAVTTSQLKVTWPNGATEPIGLNEDRRPNEIVLYTPTAGRTTRTHGGGRELILEKAGDAPLGPMVPGKTLRVRVGEIRATGNSPLAPETFVLSIGVSVLNSVPAITAGAELQISTATVPDISGATAAISGGPVLVKGGKAQRIRDNGLETFQSTSQFERHPRSAIGWNQDWFFLIEVDGRQPQLSMGMTLSELANYLVKLGCTDAMNLDGGGSATLWYDGSVRNRPCDGNERPVANAIVISKKDAKLVGAGSNPSAQASP
jgi:hypothetical protein